MLPGTVYPHWKNLKASLFLLIFMSVCAELPAVQTPSGAFRSSRIPKRLEMLLFSPIPHLLPARELRLEEPFEAFPADGNSSSVRAWEKRICSKDPRPALEKFDFTGAPVKHLQGSDFYFKAKQEVLLHRNSTPWVHGPAQLCSGLKNRLRRLIRESQNGFVLEGTSKIIFLQPSCHGMVLCVNSGRVTTSELPKKKSILMGTV